MNRKVLIIVENQPAPFDSRVWREACSLHANGYEVTVLCPRRKHCPKGFELIDGIRVYRHPMPREGDSPAGYLWEYGSALFWEFLYAWWIFLRHGFHVIQGCNPPDDLFLIAWPFKLFGVRYIFDHHDAAPELYISKFEKKGLIYRLLVILERLNFLCSNLVLATNSSYREIALQRGRMARENIFIVRNGPDLTFFKPVTADLALKHGKRYLVGYLGTMGFQDGLDILLDVAKYIQDKGRHDVHFTCVGQGTELPRLRKAVTEKGLSEMVTFTGRIPREELLAILSSSDVCVNPDRPCEMNDISTMNKIMEYMALGKPIVQFESKEGRFSAQEASVYADTGNQVPDFAEKILRLLDRPEERRRMGEYGRIRVRESLAWDYSVPNLLAAYGKALGTGTQGSAVASCERTAAKIQHS